MIYVGRLSQEKGIQTLLDAWLQLRDIELLIVGDGPLQNTIIAFIEKHQLDDTIKLLGHVEHSQIPELMQQSRFLVFPSVWYEGFLLTLMEAYSNRLPVLASAIGTIEELVIDQQTGLTFEVGNKNALADKVRYLMNHPDYCHQLGQNAFTHFNEKYHPDLHYPKLMNVYEQALNNM